MFESTVNALNDRRMICPVTAPEQFDFLMQPTNFDDVNAYLERVGRAVGRTRGGDAFFLAQRPDRRPDRTAFRDVFREAHSDLRPLVLFLELIMRAGGTDRLLKTGDRIEVNQILGVIDCNQGYRSELQSLANLLSVRADHNDRSRLMGVIGKLRLRDYLVLENPDREIYRVTGKIQWLYDVIDHLIATNTDLADEVDADGDRQGTLL